MKFACVSDTHSWGPPDLGPVDAWLHAGDIYDGRCKKLDRRWFDIEKLYIVHGNHDGNDHHNIMQKCGITTSFVELRPKLWLVGLGWVGERFFELPTERDMADICGEILRQSLLKLQNGDQTIFLSHYCARFANMNEPGFHYSSITKTIDALRPLVIIQGHRHELFKTYWKYNGILFVNPGKFGGILEVSDNFEVNWNQRQQ